MATNEQEAQPELPVSLLSVVVPPGSGLSALDWYKTALCAEVKQCYKNEQGEIMHAVMASSYGFSFAVEEFMPVDHMARPISADETPKLASATYMYVNLRDDFTPDAAVETMRDAGAVVTHEPKDMFYGERVGQVVDKFGAGWAFTKPCAPFPKNEVI